MNGASGRPAGPAAGRQRGGPAAGRQRGVALVAVLWALTLLAVLAGVFSMAARTHANLARNVLEAAKAEAIADAAVNRAIAGLLVPPEAGGIRVDGTPYAWIFDDGKAIVSVEDDGGKIDINTASSEVLADLLAQAGADPKESARMADAIVDYRDADDKRSPDGAEIGDYRAAGRPAGPKNAPFEFVEELESVYGLTPAVVAAVRPALTAYTGSADPVRELMPAAADALFAPKPGRSGRIAGNRQPRPAAAGRSEAGRTEAAGGRENPASPLGLLQPLRLDGTDARSGTNVYTIHAEAQTSSGAVFVRQAVVGITPGGLPPFRFFDWQQGRRQFEIR